MKKTGGAAFPRISDGYRDGIDHNGMTLRDYFAANAVAGLIQLQAQFEDKDAPANATLADIIAMQAYVIADAMIAERGKNDSSNIRH